MIRDGTTSLRELRLEGRDIDIEDEDLQRYVDEVTQEFRAAKDFFDGRMASGDEFTVADWEVIADWSETRKHLVDLPTTDYPEVWRLAFEEAVEERKAVAKAREAPKKARRGTAGAHQLFGADRWSVPPNLDLTSAVRSIRGPNHVPTRIRLQTKYDRAQQAAEDLEAEVRRAQDAHDQVVRPDKQLWIGLLVLLYPAIVGIVLPVIALSRGPQQFTPYIRFQMHTYFSGLAVLFGYMVYLAARLSRGRHPGFFK
ncbi:hypothetical protein [Micromonospora schwarzwaldensis]|uniref:hypothetical protein n=1 Tax=Micromonospora sp. DSM 45708 TaxID=3111767 RepID=UPI0031D1E4F0